MVLFAQMGQLVHHDHAQKLFGRALEHGRHADLVARRQLAALHQRAAGVQTQGIAHHMDLVVVHHLVDGAALAQMA
ncbi:hypothetical protein D3C85_1880200 [compost metagenome]